MENTNSIIAIVSILILFTALTFQFVIEDMYATTLSLWVYVFVRNNHRH